MASTLLTGANSGFGYPEQLDPSVLAASLYGTLSNGMRVARGQSTDYVSGTEGGEANSGSGNGGFVVFSPALGRPGGEQALYDQSGKFLRVQQIQAPSALDRIADTVTMIGLSAALGQVAMGAMGAGGAGAGTGASGPDFTSGFTDTGTAGGALDTGYAGSGALTGATGQAVPGGSFLTGPTSVNADYSLLTGNAGPDFAPLEGNAGQGINLAKASGEGLHMSTSPNMVSMGGAQGLTASGVTRIGDPNSFINNPMYDVSNAPGQVISQSGVYTPASPYVPSLGDPASFVNGGTAGAAPGSQGWSLENVVKGIQLGSQLAGLVLGGSGSLGGGQAMYAGGGVGGTSDGSRAGLAPGTPAQGGAAGTIEGVANTLLTAKDQFGYGKSMLG